MSKKKIPVTVQATFDVITDEASGESDLADSIRARRLVQWWFKKTEDLYYKDVIYNKSGSFNVDFDGKREATVDLVSVHSDISERHYEKKRDTFEGSGLFKNSEHNGKHFAIINKLSPQEAHKRYFKSQDLETIKLLSPFFLVEFEDGSETICISEAIFEMRPQYDIAAHYEGPPPGECIHGAPKKYCSICNG